MRYVTITTVPTAPSRVPFVEAQKAHIPELQLSTCDGDGFDNFIKVMRGGMNEDTLLMEDDAILCSDFKQRARAEIEKVGREHVIQFFSMRKGDLTEGSRWIRGAQFSACVCVYIPREVATLIVTDFNNDKSWTMVQGQAFDLYLGEILKRNKLRYWNVVPNLADHASVVSVIGPKRSKFRQSKTFEG